MLIPHKPLQAYSLDTATPEGGENHAAWLAGCLAYGMALDQLTHGGVRSLKSGDGRATAASLERETTDAADSDLRVGYHRLLSLVAEHDLLSDVVIDSEQEPTTDSISALTRAVAAAAEHRGALRSAYSLLTSLGRLPHDEASIENGRVLALRARVARKADSPAVAEELYRRVAVIARRCGNDELTALALIGQGVLAQSRGNYPVAHRLYAKAARAADRSANADLMRHAYHGLMVVAAQFGRLNEALKAGWIAYREASGNPEVEAEMLLNLAQLALDASEPRPALHAFAAVLTRDLAPWQRLPALGGAARAAAALQEHAVLRACAAWVDQVDRSSSAFAYPRAAALWEVARAFHSVDLPAESGAFARRAHALADQHGFHELVLETERLLRAKPNSADMTASHVVPMETPRHHLDNGGQVVLQHLTALEQPKRVLTQR